MFGLDVFPVALFFGYVPTASGLRATKASALTAVVAAVPVAATIGFGFASMLIALVMTVVVVAVEVVLVALYIFAVVFVLSLFVWREDPPPTRT